MFEIEKNVPLPPSSSGRPKYHFGEMNVGDSFVIEAADFRRVYNAAHSYGRRHGRKFTSRKQDENTVRIWRIE